MKDERLQGEATHGAEMEGIMDEERLQAIRRETRVGQQSQPLDEPLLNELPQDGQL